MKKVLFLFAVMLIAVGMSVAQTGADNSGANNGQAAQSSSSANQSTATTPSSNADQNAASQSGNADQSGTAAKGNADQNAGNSGNLPQTGSELPLLAMLGLGSLGGGLISRFRK